MQTHLSQALLNTADGREAESILRACVHCGFCNATCPTYQLLGDELDGPRGRIYQIKQMLEGEPAGPQTRLHLDRCLQCRACETTCPSGVHYARLAEIGRAAIELQQPRGWRAALFRWGLRRVLPYTGRFAALLWLGRMAEPFIPRRIRPTLPQVRPAGAWPRMRHDRTMLLLDGCVQPAATPLTNAATARVFERLGIRLERPSGQGCCGAVSYHLNAREEGLTHARRNIDAWWPAIEAGAEALVITASGCGLQVKEYGELLREDPAYAEKAARISALARDVAEVLTVEDLSSLPRGDGRRVAFHAPCTLQHGQRQNGTVEGILRRLGYELTPVADAHLCCGSAGTYSILQPELSRQLRDGKLRALTAGEPEVIATANVGCQLHLQQGCNSHVRHWIELLDPAPPG
ncbi:glycolate oxidase iron-sulfur subunit [Acidihalobacter aeolianus]|uniref:Glycolate oxidase iron-sulfur subunit n=1 Tax=Acidihalobacter aeolianus TaxID=2792603 RepID=A0A1D8K447_9GAMM|nr:glycolate oxidase subunit GlcF [Acidihalobacter aeolianus]AOV15743.1 glycolate oxidase iron-sulfur subunit [Acidihalobacter aeolianus]